MRTEVVPKGFDQAAHERARSIAVNDAALLRAQIEPKERPQRVPLPTLPSVPPFPERILPDALRPWLIDAADLARFPLEFAAVPAMTAVGSIIGRKIGLRLKARADWVEHGNIWGAIVGSPASLKSPAMREALRPLKRLQVLADENHEAQLRHHQVAVEHFKLRADAKRKATIKSLSRDPAAQIGDSCEAPRAPKARTYYTTNASMEALGLLLAENSQGLLVERDELGSLLASLEDERQAEARGLYLSGWSGQEAYRFHRITRAEVLLPAFALSIVGGIQPGVLQRFVRGAARGQRADGLLQRFQLLVWPDSVRFEYHDRLRNLVASEEVAHLFQRLDQPNLGGVCDAYSEVPHVRFEDQAQGIFKAWYTAWMQRPIDGEPEALQSHLAKFPALLGKLALITHLCDAPQKDAVGAVSLAKAIGWLDFLEPHARRVYHAAGAPETDAAHLIVARILRGELPATFSARDIYRRGWSGLGDAEAVKAALRVLVDYAWLEQAEITGAGFGRPNETIYAVVMEAP